MGHSKELITLDVYADNRNIIADGVPEIEANMQEVLPKTQEERYKIDLLDIVMDESDLSE